MPENVTILGAGSWGIAVARLLFNNGHTVRMWEFNKTDCETLLKERSHKTKLPGITIADGIRITNDLEESVNNADYIVFALPSQKIRQVCQVLDPIVDSNSRYINLAKGVEINTLLRMSELIQSMINSANENRVATLSGPSHAEEVSRDIPTSVVVGSKDIEFARQVQELFNGRYFRVYSSQDIIGVELGGSLKNVIAIASGITQGLGLGDNTTGALLTRGLAEISRMGVKLGADPLTFAGLSGVGDLITTCCSRHSRNRYVGEHIGMGETLEEVLDGMTMVAEGVDTCRSAYAMSQKYDVEMPITSEVHKVLFENKPPIEAVSDLMGRSLKEEIWS
jgi:glycerol-3-phosphate dehydrogenase (NAD(P)+)